MHKIMSIAHTIQNSAPSFTDWMMEREEVLKEKFMEYCEDFQHKVDTDTLSFREAALIFLAGGLGCQIFLWIASLFA